MFVMVFRGTKMSAFFHHTYLHTDHDFYLKHPDYQDIIGLGLNSKGVYILPQSNRYYPQMRIYDTLFYYDKEGKKVIRKDNIAVSALFTYISGFQDAALDIDENMTLSSNSRDKKLIASYKTQTSIIELCINSKGKFKRKFLPVKFINCYMWCS